MRAFLLFPLAALLFSAGCNKGAGTGVEVDSRFNGFIPTTTKALIGIKVDELKTSEFFTRHKSQLKLPQIDGMSERVGLDPTRDVSEIVLAWDGKQLMTMAHGGFQSENVEQKVAKLTTEQEKYKSLTLFGGKTQSIAFLPKSIALAGAPEEIKRAIDEAAAGGGGVPDDLQLRLHGVLPNAQVWGASSGVLPLGNVPMGSQMSSALSNLADYINGTTFGVAFDTGAHLKVDVSCISAEGAQRVNDALRGLIGFARLSTKDNELDMLRLWDSIKVDKGDRGVTVHADLPADLADKLVNQVSSMSNRVR